MTLKPLLSFSLATGALLFASAAYFAQTGQQDDDRDMAPHGKGIGTLHHPSEPSTRVGAARTPGFARSTGIAYHGGPVITNTTKLYFIYYGNWGGAENPNLTNWAQSIGGSPYFNINTTYYQGTTTKTYVTNSVAYAGVTFDNYSQGTSVSDRGIQSIVSSAITSGRLPKDTNAVYMVLTSADVNETSGFCTSYCGWHTYGTISGSNIKYAFIGNPNRCPSSCSAQSTGPNGTDGTDGMVSVMTHELEEAVTDPNLNAWYDSQGNENGDKCAWNFGTTYKTANGTLANMVLGSRNYLIQQDWNATTQACALSY